MRFFKKELSWGWKGSVTAILVLALMNIRWFPKNIGITIGIAAILSVIISGCITLLTVMDGDTTTKKFRFSLCYLFTMLVIGGSWIYWEVNYSVEGKQKKLVAAEVKRRAIETKTILAPEKDEELVPFIVLSLPEEIGKSGISVFRAKAKDREDTLPVSISKEKEADCRLKINYGIKVVRSFLRADSQGKYATEGHEPNFPIYTVQSCP